MMKNKKILAISFFVFQLLIIAGLIAYSAVFTFCFEKYGKEYKMKVDSYVYVFDGVCYFDLNQNYWDTDGKLYIIPDEQTGEYRLSDEYWAPKVAKDFIYCRGRNGRDFPWKIEYKLKDVSLEQSYYSIRQENTYITVKVFHGKAEVTAVYCDGVSIEEYIKTQSDFENGM